MKEVVRDDFLHKAYVIRSKIVHGSEFRTTVSVNSESMGIRAFITQLEKYFRESAKKLI